MKVNGRPKPILGAKFRLITIGLCTTALCIAGAAGILLCLNQGQTNPFSSPAGTAVQSAKSRPYDARRLPGDARTLAALLRYLVEPEPESGATMILTSARPAAVRAGIRLAPVPPPLLVSNRPNQRLDASTNLPAKSWPFLFSGADHHRVSAPLWSNCRSCSAASESCLSASKSAAASTLSLTCASSGDDSTALRSVTQALLACPSPA